MKTLDDLSYNNSPTYFKALKWFLPSFLSNLMSHLKKKLESSGNIQGQKGLKRKREDRVAKDCEVGNQGL